MGLLGNYSVLHKAPLKYLAGTVASGDRYNFNKTGNLRNIFSGESLSVPKFNSVPNGYGTQGWVFPQKGGGMASYKQISAEVSTTSALLANGINLTSNISGSIDLTPPQLALIVSLSASISALGSLNNPNLAGILDILANISATGTITTADLGAISGMSAALSATGLLTSTTMILLSNLSADITPYTELSPQSLAAAVWNTATTDAQTDGTMGKAVNDTKSNSGLIPGLF